MAGPTKAELVEQNEKLVAENEELREQVSPSRTGAKLENVAKPPPR